MSTSPRPFVDPVAHGEGNYAADEETIRRLEGEGRVLYRYCSPFGMPLQDEHDVVAKSLPSRLS